MKKRQSRYAWLFLLPSLSGVTLFILLPFLDAVRRSFYEAIGKEFTRLQNYDTVISNKAFQLAAGNTVKFLIVCIPLLLVISLFLSVLLSTQKKRGQLLKTAFLIPMAVPVASVVLLWKTLLHTNGLLNSFLTGIEREPVNWLNSDTAFYVLVFSYLWKNIGYNIVLWLAGLNGISESLYEAAGIDGCGNLRKFIYITLPNLRPTLYTVSVLALINSFKVFREAYLIAGDYPHESIYMLQHLFNNWFISLDIQKICAGAVLMAAVILAVVALLRFVGGKEDA